MNPGSTQSPGLGAAIDRRAFVRWCAVGTPALFFLVACDSSTPRRIDSLHAGDQPQGR